MSSVIILQAFETNARLLAKIDGISQDGMYGASSCYVAHHLTVGRTELDLTFCAILSPDVNSRHALTFIGE